MTHEISAHTAMEVLHVFGRGGYRPGDFRSSLYAAIGRADPMNKARLAAGFPEEVAAFRLGQEQADGIDRLRRIAGQDEVESD